MSAFLSVDLLTDFAAFCFNRFYRLEIHSFMVCIFDPAWELLPPMDEGTIWYLCTAAPLLYLLSDLLPPPMYSIYRQCVTVGGGGWRCSADHILQEFYTLFLTRFRTYKIASPPQTKMTSKDDSMGLVSLKFLRPWYKEWAGMTWGRRDKCSISCRSYQLKPGSMYDWSNYWARGIQFRTAVRWAPHSISLYVWSVGALFFKLSISFRNCQILSVCRSSFISNSFRIRNFPDQEWFFLHLDPVNSFRSEGIRIRVQWFS